MLDPCDKMRPSVEVATKLFAPLSAARLIEFNDGANHLVLLG
jgi:hypothetical protein